jgi:transcriptional regulator with XRE-family HTH domain
MTTRNALAKVRQARARQEASDVALQEAIVAAAKAGCRQREIAEAAQLTQARVSQILAGKR